MTQNSIEAFKATSGQRAKNKQLVFDALKANPKSTRFRIGEITGLGDIEAQRRISDLVNEGKVVIVGKRKHFKCYVSTYSIKQQLEIPLPDKKQTINAFLKEHYPHILIEYKERNNHKL